MRVAFLTNYEKTISFHRVAERLVAAGHDVHWISPSGHWARWLRGHGVPTEAVLDLSAFGPEWRRGAASEDDRRRLAALESTAALRLNDVILMDRILRDRPAAATMSYFAVASREIDRFIVDRGIELVFGEQTFGVELLTAMVCRARDRELYVPLFVRIPARRTGFFRGHQHAELVAFREVTDDHRAAAATFLDRFRRDRPRPHYFTRDAIPLPRASWPAKLAKHVRLQVTDPYDETHFSASWLVRKRSAEVLNALAHRIASPFWVPPQPPPRPYIVFPLHRQPEAAIDVVGARLSNQLELVKAMARTLPATHDLYVKEHPLGAGDRSPRALRALSAVPGVRLVDPAVSTFSLIEHADLLVTVSGTAGFEAALMRRPAVAITPMFYGAILRANGFNPYERSLSELLRPQPVSTDDEMIALLANVLAQSFPGTIENPLFDDGVLEPANIESVSGGFLELLSSKRPRST